MPLPASKMILNPSKAISRGVIFFSEKLQMFRGGLQSDMYCPRPSLRRRYVHYSLMRVLGTRGALLLAVTSYLSIWRTGVASSWVKPEGRDRMHKQRQMLVRLGGERGGDGSALGQPRAGTSHHTRARVIQRTSSRATIRSLLIANRTHVDLTPFSEVTSRVSNL